jgi:streptogramin lyase
LEDRRLLSGISGTTEFPVQAIPRWITLGPDGDLWTYDTLDGLTDVFSPTTHTTTQLKESWGIIAAGPDGNAWATQGQYIIKINPVTFATTSYRLPQTGPHAYFNSAGNITAGPDGNLWFTDASSSGAAYIAMINPTTDGISEFATPNLNSGVSWMTPGPGGNLSFTDGDSIGMFNLTTHAVTEFPVGIPFPDRTITAGPDGNLWFPLVTGIGQFNPTTHAIAVLPIPASDINPSFITSGPDGNVWFTDAVPGSARIGRVNVTTGAITEYPLPYTNSFPQGITTGADGNLWFADHGTHAIAVATLSSTELVVTQQPPASVTAGSPFGLTVQAEDSSGNPVASFNGTVTVGLGINPGGATLGGTLTATATNGVATFSGLPLNTAASSYTLVVSGVGLGWGVTSPMTVTPAAATQVVITQQPSATVAVNSPFNLQASIEDAYGNVVTTATNTVNVAFANDPTGAPLGGTLSVTTSQGVASFTNLTINRTGSGYTLQVSSSGLTSATSNPINVTKNGRTASTLLAPAGSPATDLSLAPLVLDSPDLWDGLGFKKRSRPIG